MKIELSARGVHDSSGIFRRAGDRATNVKPVWRRLIDYLMESERRRFDVGKLHWKSLDADTIRRKGNDRPLIEDGTLERALTVWSAPGQKRFMFRQSMVFGLQPRGIAYYGKFHQEGDSVPQRRPLEPPKDFADKAGEFLLDHLLGR